MEQVSSLHGPTGKFPEKVENLKRWARFPGWNFRTECRVPFTFPVVCTSSRSTVGHRDVPGFTTKWNNFLPIGNSTFAPTEISGFFPKWKAPHVFFSQPAIATPISIKRIEPLCLSDSSGMHYPLDNTYHQTFRPTWLSISQRRNKTTTLTLPADKNLPVVLDMSKRFCL